MSITLDVEAATATRCGASARSPERIDQGVDYSGFGPIYAIGDGVVLSTVGGGWPGGTFIAYQLTDGPASGLVVYAAEDIEPSVQVGATVNSGTVLGQMYAGPDGIETGWADGSVAPTRDGPRLRQFDGSSFFGLRLQLLPAPRVVLGATGRHPERLTQRQPPIGVAEAGSAAGPLRPGACPPGPRPS